MLNMNNTFAEARNNLQRHGIAVYPNVSEPSVKMSQPRPLRSARLKLKNSIIYAIDEAITETGLDRSKSHEILDFYRATLKAVAQA